MTYFITSLLNLKILLGFGMENYGVMGADGVKWNIKDSDSKSKKLLISRSSLAFSFHFLFLTALVRLIFGTFFPFIYWLFFPFSLFGLKG